MMSMRSLLVAMAIAIAFCVRGRVRRAVLPARPT